MEDFGWAGDEFLMGECQDDHIMQEELNTLHGWAMQDAEESCEDEREEGWEYAEEVDYLGEDDVPLDGDAESALASCGWGTDEDYGCYDGGDW